MTRSTLFEEKINEPSIAERVEEGETIRALWWRQPYAQLMLHGKVETRTRPTKVRGLVMICSTKVPYGLGDIKHIAGVRLESIAASIAGKDMPNGHAIAIGELVNSYPMELMHEGVCYVEYRAGLYCWEFRNVQAIEPFPLPGKQGWGFIDDETRAKIKLI